MAILALWAVFWIYWIVSAFTANESRHDFNPRGIPLRLATGIAIALGLRGLTAAGVRLNALSVHAAPVIALGFLLLILGLAFAVWARLHLGRNWGMPATRRVAPELISSGPYTYVRHPIYSGLLLAGVGTSVAINVIGVVIVALLIPYFLYAARVEEHNMTAVFPEAYPAYQKRSRLLIPFLL
jgi:protein-S-isoprenylcysteine O-methyltransferase Ste14